MNEVRLVRVLQAATIPLRSESHAQAQSADQELA
jgi:hypothetical protein